MNRDTNIAKGYLLLLYEIHGADGVKAFLDEVFTKKPDIEIKVIDYGS